MLTLAATPMPQSVPRPMLASLDAAPLADPRFAYEPKYDGIRALAMVRAGGGPDAVRLWSRLGNDKTGQFPEIVRALADFARKLKAALPEWLPAYEEDHRRLNADVRRALLSASRATTARTPSIADSSGNRSRK